MKPITDRINGEPVATFAVVQAILGAAVAFGLDLTGEQTAAVLTVTAAVLGWWTRTKVTPTGDPTVTQNLRDHTA